MISGAISKRRIIGFEIVAEAEVAPYLQPYSLSFGMWTGPSQQFGCFPSVSYQFVEAPCSDVY